MTIDLIGNTFATDSQLFVSEAIKSREERIIGLDSLNIKTDSRIANALNKTSFFQVT